MTTVVEATGAEGVPAMAPGQPSSPAPTAPAPARRAPRLRADAVRNRERIVAAARDVFVEDGADAPLDEIARRAGIGNATLYRHFPDRQALAHAVLLSVVTRTADHAAAEAAHVAAGGEPCAALRRFAHTAVGEKVGALCGLFVKGDDAPADLAAQTARLKGALDTLMDHGRTRGRLRPDVTRDDLLLAISRLTRPLPGLDCPDEDVHRHLQMFLDGLKADTKQA